MKTKQLKGRKRRNSLRQASKIAGLPASVEPLPLSSHAWIRLPALPFEQSNVISLGKVTDRHAVLTDDRLGVYSEFSISVSEIFKDDLNPFFIGQVITASRPGGAVAFLRAGFNNTPFPDRVIRSRIRFMFFS